jgi:glycosyltransferase involved in cell wall biosynthesis
MHFGAMLSNIMATGMKIAHVVDSMEIGGAETLVAQMCSLQRKQGHDPSVYAVLSLGPLGERLRQDGFTVLPHVGRHLLDATRHFFQIFKQTRPDVVHLHNPTPTVYAAMAARMAGVPSIVSTRHSLVARPRKLLVELKYSFAACFCDWIVGICDATSSNLKSIHSIPVRKIQRVYNGATPLLRVAKDQWPTKHGFTLVYVGRLEPVKNHALLLNAFRIALASMPGLKLWMVGDGSERKNLECLATKLEIEQQVTFWGQKLDVAPFFSAADVFIMSSDSEGLPISLIQAFSLGVPAIVTDVGGMSEVVRMANAGITVSVTSPEEMSAAILRMAVDNAEREIFAKNAESAFFEHFTLQNMTNAYMNLYRNYPHVKRAVVSEKHCV